MVCAMRAPDNLAACWRPMGPTDCLASLIDRSLHLLLQLRVGLSANAPAGQSVSGGECRFGIHPRSVVTFTCRHELPGDAGNFVGKRDGRQLWRLARDQGEKPARVLAAAAPGLLDHRGRPDHEQAAQVLVARARDLAKPRFARGGVVLWRQSEPGRKVTAGAESVRI